LKISQKVKNMIILKITGLSKEQLFLAPKIEERFIHQIEQALKRLEDWEPVEYIIETSEFYWLDFFVDPRVLIPRNDTEIMVDCVLNELLEKNTYNLIDVLTGSSCIPISIIKNSENILKSYVIDISKSAIDVAKINIKKHWLGKVIEPIHWNLLNNFIENKKYVFNENIIITANLPYIKNWDFKNMDPEVVTFEPDSALYWGKKTGFELYEELIKQAIALKKQCNINNILLFIEIWFDQKEISEMYLNTLGLKFDVFKDNWWIERCIRIEI